MVGTSTLAGVRCPGNCHWRQHVNNSYYFEIYHEDEERTQNDLKQKYAKAEEGKTQVQALIEAINNRLSELDEHIMGMISQV